MENTKKCIRCGVVKPVSEFKYNQAKKEFGCKCLKCSVSQNKAGKQHKRNIRDGLK